MYHFKKLVKNKPILDYVSDLHIDKYPQIHPRFDFLKKTKKDRILAIVGDLTDYNPVLTRNFLSIVSDKYKHILYVPGNHEYWNNYKISKEKIDNELQFICNKLKNVSFLNNSSIVIDDIKYIGSTLWSHIDNSSQKDYLSNYTKILTNNNKLTIADTNHLHHNSVNYIINNTKDEQDTIVLTHFAPLKNCKDYKTTHERFERNTEGFSSDLRELIKSPIKVWIYGHTHYENQFKYNKVLIASYPIGNYSDNKTKNTIYN